MRHVWLMAVLAAACSRNNSAAEPAPSSNAEPEARAKAEETEPAAEPTKTGSDDAHRVVFADRTSQGYLLLVDDAHKAEPSREQLVALVEKKLAGDEANPEVELLTGLIQTEPTLTDPRLAQEQGRQLPAPDLLGLHVDVMPLSSEGGELVSTEQLTDPVLTRELDPAQRASLATRRYAILIRADYRNQHAVRGLRLLQTLVRLVAENRDALIHDPDTGETMGVEAFTRRRLQNSLGNVADQVAVVPFPDPRHGEGSLRLSTRGMRRFGSVDLELDGLPRDPAVLQAASHLLYGLAYQMVRLGEFDSTGYAVELDDTVSISRDNVVQAYGRRNDDVPTCEDCPRNVTVHLVERASEPHDPADHVVARVVAPRSESDADDYDHPAWVSQALHSLLGT